MGDDLKREKTFLYRVMKQKEKAFIDFSEKLESEKAQLPPASTVSLDDLQKHENAVRSDYIATEERIKLKDKEMLTALSERDKQDRYLEERKLLQRQENERVKCDKQDLASAEETVRQIKAKIQERTTLLQERDHSILEKEQELKVKQKAINELKSTVDTDSALLNTLKGQLQEFEIEKQKASRIEY